MNIQKHESTERRSVNRLMNEQEAVEYLNCKVSTLRKWRLLEKGPVYIQVGRLVRYSEADLIAFMDANRVQPAGVER
jgi:hypothetical protein